MIDLQKEMDIMINKERWTYMILRHLTDKLCSCVRAESGTPDPECPNCQGHKWIFNEYLFKCMFFYSAKMVAHEQDFTYGLSYNNIFEIYAPVNKTTELISINDNVFQIEMTAAGKPLSPIKRTKRWVINDVYDLRLDEAKRQFIKLYAKPSVTQ